MTGPKMLPEAAKLVQEWIDQQLRTEGREGIYLDDEVALACSVSDAIRIAQEQARREAIEKCAQLTRDAAIEQDEKIRATPLYNLESEIRALLEQK